MEILRPIKSKYTSQRFGENKACITRSGRILGKIKDFCPAGSKDFYKSIGMKGHNGTDSPTWYREPVFFSVNANTTWYAKTEMDSSGGLGLDIFSRHAIDIPILPPQTGEQAKAIWKANAGKIRVKFRFWHADANAVADGQNINIGDFIQYSGSTGLSSGNHVHFSMKFVDANDVTVDKNNGYFGSVDHTYYYRDIFIGDYMTIKKKVLSLTELVTKLVFSVKIYFNRLNKN